MNRHFCWGSLTSSPITNGAKAPTVLTQYPPRRGNCVARETACGQIARARSLREAVTFVAWLPSISCGVLGGTVDSTCGAEPGSSRWIML